MTASLADRAGSEEHRARLLRANADALELGGRTLETLLEASPVGRIVRGKDGAPALEVRGAKLDAIDEVARTARAVEAAGAVKDGLVVLFGLGAGNLLRAVRQQGTARVVVFEPDPGILRTVLEDGPSDFGGVPIFTDARDLQVNWITLLPYRAEVVVIVTAGYAQAYSRALTELNDTLTALANDTTLYTNTRSFRFREWIRNVLGNIPVLSESSSFLALHGQFHDVPAFIVGAGPSLDKNGQLLAEAARKGIVFAMDVSAPALVRHGAEPQVMVCIEGVPLAKSFAELPFADRVVRAYSMIAHPENLQSKGGPVMPFFDAHSAFAQLGELFTTTGINIGGSVSTGAFSLAVLLGCSPIVLVGQDLAYADDRTHAEGTPFAGSRVDTKASDGRVHFRWSKEMFEAHEGHEIQPWNSEPMYQVESFGGGGVVTSTRAFNAFRSWFTAAADRLSDTKIRFVNATEGGSRIPRFEEQTLAAVLRDLPERNITAAQLAARGRELSPPPSAEKVAAWARLQLRRVRVAQKAARRVQTIVSDAQRSFHSDQPAAVNAAFARLTEGEKRLRRLLADARLVEAWCYGELQALREEGRGHDAGESMRGDAEWSLRFEGRIAGALERAAGELTVLLQELVKRVAR